MNSHGSIPLTQEGFDKLTEELKQLKEVERPKVIQDIAEARAHGDLKENAEYHAAREKQGFIEGRITMLDDQLSRANVIDFSEDSPEIIKFGAYFSVEDQNTGDVNSYRIVGDIEADISNNLISLASPFARAMLGKNVDDLVLVKSPKGEKEYLVTSISYQETV